MSPSIQSENVQVVIRVRPANEREKSGGQNARLCLSVKRNEEIEIDMGPQKEPMTFTFDYVAT